MEPIPAAKIIYSEVVRPPFWLFAFILFLTESMAVSIWAAFDNRVGVTAFIVSLLIALAARSAMAMKIEVTQDELRIQRAHIERRYLGAITELNSAQMALIRGRDADPAAHLAIRFWQPLGIKVLVQDERDPTPYWLIATKKPSELSKALYRD